MKELRVKDVLSLEKPDADVNIKGWVRTKRGSKNVAFIALNDGSILHNIQIVADRSKFNDELLDQITTGSSISVIGNVVESQGSGQKFEIEAENIVVLGESDPEKYPLQPKKHSLEFLREIAHLRFRTNTFSAIARVRHQLIFQVHNYFHGKGFYNIHTPIITGSDAEGAGETFQVTNFDLENLPKNEDGKVDYKQDFFGKETNLTVSGQLEAELAAMALGKVYTFGPTFRAENSNTTRHLAEFWMIEPEMAFADLNDDMDLAEDFLKFLINKSLEHCSDDLHFLDSRLAEEEKSKKQEDRSSMGLLERLKFVTESSFERISYTEAIEILKNSKANKKKKFAYPIDNWGADLQSEHEKYLVEKHFGKPVIIHDYPMEIKAFYMRQNDDGKTVAAMDVLFPGIGEIVGGSQREERLEKLVSRMQEMNVDSKELYWYLDSRAYGTAVHSGFGLGFERLVQFITGMGNIRDVIPFPRSPKNADF